MKAGPNTINKDDIKTIIDHFSAIRNLARTNHLDVRTTDCIVGVFYGTGEELSSSYKKIDEIYPVYIGADFWYRLTGEPRFYYDLIDAFVEVADEMNSSTLVESLIQQLSQNFR